MNEQCKVIWLVDKIQELRFDNFLLYEVILSWQAQILNWSGKRTHMVGQHQVWTVWDMLFEMWL